MDYNKLQKDTTDNKFLLELFVYRLRDFSSRREILNHIKNILYSSTRLYVSEGFLLNRIKFMIEGFDKE